MIEQKIRISISHIAAIWRSGKFTMNYSQMFTTFYFMAFLYYLCRWRTENNTLFREICNRGNKCCQTTSGLIDDASVDYIIYTILILFIHNVLSRNSLIIIFISQNTCVESNQPQKFVIPSSFFFFFWIPMNSRKHSYVVFF